MGGGAMDRLAHTRVLVPNPSGEALKLEYEERGARMPSVGIAVSDEAVAGADGDEDPLPPKPDRPLDALNGGGNRC